MSPMQIVLEGDTARVHINDPVTAHLAADFSAVTRRPVREHVLEILRENGPLAAFEVCDMYAEFAKWLGWPRVHHESPRKRLSDMKREGILVETGETRLNWEGSPEVVVALKAGA